MSHDNASNTEYALNQLETDSIEKDLLQHPQSCFNILDHIGIGVVLIDRNMKILKVNKYLKDRFSYTHGTKNRLCYQTFNVPGFTDPCPNCPTKKVFKTGQTHEATLETPTPEGILHLHIISSPIFNQSGEVTSAIEIIEDVTQKRQTQLELDAANQRFRDIAFSCNDFIWEIDNEGRLLYVSGNIISVTGYSSQELLGHYYFDFIIDEKREEERSRFKQKMNKQEPLVDREHWLKHRDGSCSCVQANGVPFYDDAGHWLGYRGASTNITAHKEYESKLTASEKKFKSISESAKDAIIMMGSQGDISFWNQAAQDIFGYTEEEALGQNLHQLLSPPAYHDEQAQKFPHFRKTGQGTAIGKTLELEGRRKDGTIFPVELSVSSFKLEGDWHAVGIVRDISERKQIEMQQTQLLEQINRSNQQLEEFAHIVSHDLKAPLRGIKTLLDWFISDYQNLVPPEGKEQLTLVQQRSQRMQDMIQGILEYSRIGKGDFTTEDLNMNQLLANIVDILAAPENIHIEVQKELPTLTGERIQITQVFQNLLSNAIKYNDKEKGFIQITHEVEDLRHHYCICDNGPGIDPSHHEKIFGIFQTLQPKDAYESTGIGLSVVKKIIERHQGRIWVESNLGEGAIFHVILP